MPDAGQLIALLVVGGVVAAFIGAPLYRRASPGMAGDDELEAAARRRDIAYAALRDLEADRGAGSLSETDYRRQRADGEERAAAALAALDAVAASGDEAPAGSRGDRASSTTRGAPAVRAAALVGALLAGALLVGFLLPHPVSLANPTRVDEALDAAIAAEEERRAEIERLLDHLAANPRDATAFSDLADLYLAGSTAQDLASAAAALLAVIQLEPENESAYVRLIGAYLRAGDYENAAAATDAFARLAPDSPDLALFQGIIALRHERDPAAAIEAFDRFLVLAPDDPRANMVRSLRAEAAGQLPEDD